MFNRIRQDDQGFTLIELLVVILIIGILAAIALPAFLGQRAKGQDSAAKSDARNAVSQVESCFVEAQTYATCGADIKAAGINTGTGAEKVAYTGNVEDYTIVATSKSGNTFTITRAATGVLTRQCTATQPKGSCNDSWRST